VNLLAKKRRRLTVKQKNFADEYIISGNASEAYKLAGYAWKTDGAARTNASILLTNHNVKAYIDERIAEMDDRAIAKQEEVLKYLSSVMRGESEAEVVVVEGEGDGYSSARRVKKNPDERERLKAAELLGKRYGTFTEKYDVLADLELRINIDYGDEDD